MIWIESQQASFDAVIIDFPDPNTIALGNDLTSPLRYVSNDLMPQLFELPQDMQPVAVEIIRVDNQALVRYYESDQG